MSNKKQQKGKSLSPEQIKSMKEAHKKEMESYKQKVLPLYTFLEKKKLRFENAMVNNENRIHYFRVEEYDKIIQDHQKEISSSQTLAENVRRAKEEDFIYFKRPDAVNAKYPKALEPVQPSSDSKIKKYASFRFDTTPSRKWLPVAIISAVLILVLFPVWPYEVKYIIWLVSLVLLVVLVGIIVLRLALFLLCVIFGYQIWIFPNLLSAPGFWESFIPIIEYSRTDRSWFDIFLRLFALFACIALACQLYLNPNLINQHILFTRETIVEAHDWGVGKLKNKSNFSQRALTNLEIILNQTADVESQDPAENVDQITAKIQDSANHQQEQQQVYQEEGQGQGQRQGQGEDKTDSGEL